MAFAQSLNNQSSILRINMMVVDDDHVSLEMMSHMLERSKYRDPSMEITVIAVRDAREALSTLKIQRSNIDLIVTDYDMPGMNGLQLKRQITLQFGDFPFIVMSSDINKEQESLACGAFCFLPKPIKQTDLPQIYQVALTYTGKGKSILRTEHNHKDTNISILQKIQLLPEQANVSKTKKNNKFSSRSYSRSVKKLKRNCDSADGSRTNQKRKSNNVSGDDVESMPQPSKKSKISWTHNLQNLFLQAIQHIGPDKAKPKKILEFMDVPYLTKANIASHLQKYRHFSRKISKRVRGSLCSTMLHGRGMEPYLSNYTTSSSWYDPSLNNKSSYSKPSYSLGQCRLLSNTCEPVHLNQMPYNYMNRLPSYEPNRIVSNLNMPINSSLSFSTQLLQNKESKSFFEPTVMGNITGQTSQVMGFGQHGMSAINDKYFNNTVSSYGSSTSTQPGMNNLESLKPIQPGMSSYESVSPNQLGMSSQGSLIPNPQGMIIYGSLTSNQPGMSNHESLSPNQLGMSSHGSLNPTQPGMSSYGSLYANQLGMSNHGSLNPTQQGMSSYGSLSHTQPRMSSHGSLSPNQPGMCSHGSLNPTQQRMSSYGSLSPNQPGMNIYGSLTPTEPGIGSHESLSPNQPRKSSHGSLTPTQPEMSSFGNLTTNQPQMSSSESLTPDQQGPSHFSYALFLNNENTASKPHMHASATIQPNPEILQLENISLYDDLGNINELLCDISNLDFDQETEQQQEEVVSTNKFEISANFYTELNQIFSLEEDDGWTFLNTNQGHSNEETSNTFATLETNDPTLNINPNHAQEQDVPDFDWSLLDLE